MTEGGGLFPSQAKPRKEGRKQEREKGSKQGKGIERREKGRKKERDEGRK